MRFLKSFPFLKFLILRFFPLSCNFYYVSFFTFRYHFLLLTSSLSIQLSVIVFESIHHFLQLIHIKPFRLLLSIIPISNKVMGKICSCISFKAKSHIMEWHSYFMCSLQRLQQMIIYILWVSQNFIVIVSTWKILKFRSFIIYIK